MIYLIAAMTKTGVIGKENKLPWNIPDELKHFRRLTQGATVIMGMKTFESIGKPLPNRLNIVLNQTPLIIPGVEVCVSREHALCLAQKHSNDIFIIGGAYTYAQFLSDVSRMYISYIKHAYAGDVFFPNVNWDEWNVIEQADYPEFEVFVYERKQHAQ